MSVSKRSEIRKTFANKQIELNRCRQKKAALEAKIVELNQSTEEAVKKIDAEKSALISRGEAAGITDKLRELGQRRQRRVDDGITAAQALGPELTRLTSEIARLERETAPEQERSTLLTELDSAERERMAILEDRAAWARDRLGSVAGRTIPHVAAIRQDAESALEATRAELEEYQDAIAKR